MKSGDKNYFKMQEEKQLLKHFINIFPEIPKGKIVKQESPDFILHTSRHHSIGIELTKLFLQKKKEDRPYFEPLFEEKKIDLINRVRDAFIKQYAYHVSAHFDFDDTYFNASLDVKELVENILQCIYDYIMQWDGNDHFQLMIKSEDLPKWLTSISLVHHAEDTVSNWVPCKVDVPYENFLLSLEHSIAHKEEKLILYRKNLCDEYYLLIVAECLECASPFSINNLLERMVFPSRFHRIFLFDLFVGKVFELRETSTF